MGPPLGGMAIYLLFLVTTFFLGDFLMALEDDCLMPFDNLDFSLSALFFLISFTLTALSSAENTAVRFSEVALVRAFLIAFFKASSRFLFFAVRTLSFRIFLMADLIKGMRAILT